MTVPERLEIAKETFAECIKTFEVKGEAYASNKDSLSNFKRNAERLGMSPYQIWAVYFNKHVDSVNNAILQNPLTPVDKSEGLESRVTDLINYAMLLRCLLIEGQKPEVVKQ